MATETRGHSERQEGRCAVCRRLRARILPSKFATGLTQDSDVICWGHSCSICWSVLIYCHASSLTSQDKSRASCGMPFCISLLRFLTLVCHFMATAYNIVQMHQKMISKPCVFLQLIELKNGETFNGHMVLCDTWMNIHLREVICTSKVSVNKC